jgi:methylenetetrahydrofolate dehydrogenase (NADP+)/methenyltetrahydrofolate cyclohydrolase
MTATIVNGDEIAADMNAHTASVAEELTRRGHPPHLASIQVGENPASRIYTNMQARACESVGIDYELVTLPDDISPDELYARIGELNADGRITGIIMQLPLPRHVDARAVQQTIDPHKDVEGVHPQNMGMLFYGDGPVAPCTAMAAVKLIENTVSELAGQEVVVVGHSEIMGKPVAAILLQSPNSAPTVTVCHVATRDLAAHTRNADILVVATGVPQVRWLAYKRRKKEHPETPLPDLSPLISPDMIKEGAVVVDVAINRIPKGFDENGEPLKNKKGKTAMQTVGDVDYDACIEKAGAITPVPGGVGPVTVAMLLRNTVSCAKAMQW